MKAYAIMQAGRCKQRPSTKRMRTIKSKVCFRNGDNENRIIFLTKK